MFSPIHHTFGPHADHSHMLDSVRIQLQPWHWVHGPHVSLLEQELQRRFRAEAVLFGSGREGLLALLKALNVSPGEEIILQGYTCMVLANAIHAAGAVPVYADIERDTLNFDMADVQRRITKRTRAIICQHTFGIPSDTRALRDLCDTHQLAFIEDCAHVLPDDSGPDAIGKIGDAMLVSFGRDKAISGVAGGGILTRNPVVAAKLRDLQRGAADQSAWRILMLLKYPLNYGFLLPFYGIGIGKALAWALGKTGMLIPVLDESEKQGRMSPVLTKMPNGCAYLALQSLQRLRHINDHRRMLTAFYCDAAKARGWPMLGAVHADLPLLKFPLFVKNAGVIRAALKRQNIYLDDGWTGCVVCPESVDLPSSGYEPGSDPAAEAACEQILSLPTHPTMTLAQAQRLCILLDSLIES